MTTTTKKPLTSSFLAYMRRRNRHRVHSALLERFVHLSKSEDLRQVDLARLLSKNPAQINRLLGEVQNLTLDTISDLAAAMGGELEFEFQELGRQGSQSLRVHYNEPARVPPRAPAQTATSASGLAPDMQVSQ